MQSTWLNTLANWNPQLLREFRGRLKLRSVLAAIALSLIVQLLMVLGVISAIDYPPTGVSKILWEKEKWRDLWESMAWMMSYILFAVGAYFLVNDISQEERSGTMNFIRSSPRPPYQILIGKLLGVPILPYLAIAIAFPLHWFAGLRGGVPPLIIGSYDLLLGAGCVLFFSPALLLGLLNNTQRSVAGQSLVSFAYTGLMIFSLIPLYLTWNFQTTWKLDSAKFASRIKPLKKKEHSSTQRARNVRNWLKLLKVSQYNYGTSSAP
jgi:ABC-type transport system involved in multi-copper enzyme maturation permease subunit